VAEGGSIVYTATLTNAAGSPVTVTLSNGAVITIEAGKTTGTVTVPAPADDVYKDAGKVEATIKAPPVATSRTWYRAPFRPSPTSPTPSTPPRSN
jgi:hypothetical protein